MSEHTMSIISNF